MNNLLSARLHAHTDASIQDAKMTKAEYIARAKEIGLNAIAITDHGNLLNSLTFYAECKAAGIKPIIGCELYVGDERRHMIMLAKNLKGYRTLCELVTESNKNIVTSGKFKFPVVTKEMLQNMNNKNDVVVMSACISGVLAKELLFNHQIDKEIKKIEKKIKNLDYNKELVEKYNDLKANLDCLKEQKKDLQLKAKKTYKSFETKAKKLLASKYIEDNEAGKKMMAKAEKIKQQKEYAILKISEIQDEITDISINIKKIEKEAKKNKKNQEKSLEYASEINELNQQKRADDFLYENTKRELMFYKSLFPDFYIEIQYHKLPEEKEVFPKLIKLAKETNTPLVATDDAHIARKSKSEVLARNYIRSLKFGIYVEITEADKELYLHSDTELRAALKNITDDDVIDECFKNISNITKKCNLEFSNEKFYPKYYKGDAVNALRYECETGKKRLIVTGRWNPTYQKRLEYELSVIEQMGFSDYLMIVQDFIKEGLRLGKLNPENVGIGIGFGRGSACGSLVCYLTKITNIDPIKYGLKFERFLNPERVSMPDIDTDMAQFVRDGVIQYVRKKYGNDRVCYITTLGTQAGKSAIRNVARVYGWEKGSQKNDSIKKKYLSVADKLCKEIQTDDWYTELMKNPRTNEEKEIIEIAHSVSGTIMQTGVHAAGIVISDEAAVSKHLPLMWSDDVNAWKTQCEKEDVENQGCLKFDFLGLKTLDIITLTLRAIKRNYGLSIEVDDIMETFDKKVFENIFQKGLTDDIFQFSSPGMKDILKSFKPETINVLILLNAVYRPGPIDFIPDILKSKNGETKPKYIIDGMDAILDETYGFPVYQEQIMSLFELAGFSVGEADNIRRLMSKKKTDKFLKYQYSTEGHKGFVDGMMEKGASEKDALELWDSLVSFSKYAFNKSHATTYAILAYVTAYLKYYFPAEYEAAYLSIKPDEIAKIVNKKDDFSLKYMLADINRAEYNFVAEKNKKIIVGFKAIMGFGKGSVETVKQIISKRKEKPFTSVKDLLLRTDVDKKMLIGLIKSGSLDKIIPSRRVFFEKYNEEKTILEHLMNLISNVRGAENEDKRAEALSRLQEFDFDLFSFSDSQEEMLAFENEALGTCISADLIDIYEKKGNLVSDAVVGQVQKVFGMIHDANVIIDRNGKKMAFCKITSGSETAEGVVFAREYASMLFSEGVFSVTGEVTEKYDEYKEMTVKQIVIKKIEKCKEKSSDFLISLKNEESLIDFDEIISPFLSKGEKNIYLFQNGQIISTDYYISEKQIKKIPYSYKKIK